MAGIRNLEIYRNTDFAEDIYFKDTNGALIDMTGSTFAAEVRDAAIETATLIFTFGITLDLVNGKITLTVTDTVSEALTAGTYYWDLIETDSAGLKRAWLKGTVDVIQGPTT